MNLMLDVTGTEMRRGGSYVLPTDSARPAMGSNEEL